VSVLRAEGPVRAAPVRRVPRAARRPGLGRLRELRRLDDGAPRDAEGLIPGSRETDAGEAGAEAGRPA
jgi:hypothetical protein